MSQPTQTDQSYIRKIAQEIVQVLAIAHAQEASVKKQEALVEIRLRALTDEIAKMMTHSTNAQLAEQKELFHECLIKLQTDLLDARQKIIQAQEEIRRLEKKELPVQCAHCNGPVPKERHPPAYATPVCYTCVPPHQPLTSTGRAGE